jgi:hypothetical protein
MSKEAAEVADTKDVVDARKDTKDTAKDTKAADTTILSAKPALVDQDGNLTEGWKDHWLPEDLRGEKSLEVIKTFPDLVKRTVNAEKMVGKNKVVVPTEKSTPEEWDAFYAAGGRPKTAGDYKAEIPEDFKELYPEARLKKYREIAYACGAGQKQFDAFVKADVQAAQDLLVAEEEREQKQKADADALLHKELGAAYEERMEASRRLVREAIPNEEQRMEFLGKYGNDPDFIRFTSIVGARLSESKAIIADMTKSTPAEAQAKIKQLRATEGYMQLGSKMTQEQRDALTAQIAELTRQAYPPQKQAV